MIDVVLNGRYRIIELVGTGGMAQVYRAENLSTHKYVAIKMLRAEYRDNPEFLRRFEREAKAVLHLSHDNIVHAYGVGQYENMPYIILEFVEGRTLKEIITERGAISPKAAVSIINQVLDALSAAHDGGIIHRDVKPQNVIMTDDEKKAKLTDFGIARDANATTVTFAGSTVLGSAHYISPEQAKGRAVTAASDIYSAGVMLYEMLTGTVPFTGDTTVSIALKHINEEPLPPIELNPRIPPALNDVVLKAMSKDPEQRYRTAKAMKRDLIRALKDPYGEFARPGAKEEAPKKHSFLLDGEKLHGAWKIAIVVGFFVCALLGAFFAIRSAVTTTSGLGLIVPSLIEKTVSDAAQRAENYGFSLEVSEYAPSTEVPYGCVISQTPEVGVSGKHGTVISVVVSLGPDAPVVPDLSGKTYDEVVALLSDVGLSLGSVSYQVSDVQIGYVCSQSPLGGTEVAAGTNVNVCISATEASTLQMPDVGSLTLGEALIALNGSGFHRIFLRYDTKAIAAVSAVLEQLPQAGETVQPNMDVTLTLSGKRSLSYVSDVAYNINIANRNSLVMVTIEETIDGVTVERVLYETTLEKGEKVPISFTADADSGGNHELILYINGAEVRRQDTLFTEKAS